MNHLEEEVICGCFEPGLIDITSSTIIKSPIARIKLERNAELDLLFTTTMPGIRQPDAESRIKAGAVRQSNDTIHFSLAGGGVAVANGVVQHDHSSLGKVGYGSETNITYSAHSLEVDYQRSEAATYIIEWIDNLPKRPVWTNYATRKSQTELTETLGRGEDEIKIRGTTGSDGGENALHLKVDGYDLYLLRSPSEFRGTNNKGKIVYKGTPSLNVRNKIRDCVSFVLGRPIVFYGSTEFCSEWHIKSMYSVSAFSIGGAMFRLVEQPPYPISSPPHNVMIDQQAANHAINALYANYDVLKFQELAWSYWYAMCAPIHTSAVYFGGLIEKLQRNAPTAVDTTISKLINRDHWKTIQDAVKSAIASMELGAVERAVILNKISNINQAPQNVILKRTFESMALSISDLEAATWRDRNSAAHGDIRDNPVRVILNSKVLRLIFHRLLAGITYCSDHYIDYYNLNFPTRPLNQAVPARED